VLPTLNTLDQHACACDFEVGGLCDSDDGYEQPSVLNHFLRPELEVIRRLARLTHCRWLTNKALQGTGCDRHRLQRLVLSV
jgi:hypothetical protein